MCVYDEEDCLQVGWTPDDQVIYDHLWGRAVPGGKPSITAPSILVCNKVDLATSRTQATTPIRSCQPRTVATFSVARPASNSNARQLSTDTSNQARSANSVSQQPTANQQPVGSHSFTADTSPSTSSDRHDLSAQCEVSDGAISSPRQHDAEDRVLAGTPTVPTAATRQSTANAEAAPPGLCDPPGSSQSGVQDTAAVAAASAVFANEHASLARTPASKLSAPPSLGSSSSTQEEAARDLSIAYGLPSSYSASFAACVETCAVSGLGLGTLSTALLQLSNAPSLAAGQFVVWATFLCGSSAEPVEMP